MATPGSPRRSGIAAKAGLNTRVPVPDISAAACANLNLFFGFWIRDPPSPTFRPPSGLAGFGGRVGIGIGIFD